MTPDIREILEELVKKFDVEKNELVTTTMGRIMVEKALTSAIQSLKDYEELKTVLKCWHDIFGTTQLTHASERLRIAEENAKKYQELRERIDEGKIVKELDKLEVNEHYHTPYIAQALITYLEGRG